MSLLSLAPALVAAASIFVLLSFMGSLAEWVATVFVFLLFSLAFLPLTITFFWENSLRRRDSAAFGMAASIVLSCAFASLFVYSFGWHISFLIIFLSVVGLCNLMIRRFFPIRRKPVEEYGGNREKSLFEYILLVLVLCSIAIPLLGIGKLTPKGMAYSSLLGYDFLNRVSYTIAVARGIPTENPFFAGRPFPYHILAYVLPAFVYKILGTTANIQHILRIFSFLLAIILVSCFFAFLRAYRFSAKTRICLGILAFFAYSYNGLAVFFRNILLSHGGKIADLLQQRDLLNFSSASHGLFRTLIIEPHSVLVLCIAMALFSLVRSDGLLDRFTSKIVFGGALLGASLGVEIFLGAALTLWFGSTVLFVALTRKESRKGAVAGLAGIGLIFLLSALLYSKMGIMDFGANRGSLTIAPSLTFLLTAPALIPIELGPSIIFAACFLVGKRGRPEKIGKDSFAIMSMLAIGFFGIFFVHHASENVLVLRKSVMILQIPLWLMSGMLIEDRFREFRFRRFSTVLAAGLVVLSFQTFFLDVRTFSAWNEPRLTAYISPAEYAACRWIIKNTSSDSVVQSWISYGSEIKDGEARAYSIIPEFAERPTAIGIWEIAWYSRTKEDTPGTRWKDVRDILFRGVDAREAWSIARKYNIDYIFVGPYEKKEAAEGCEKFGESPEEFELLYAENNVAIYGVRQAPQEAGTSRTEELHPTGTGLLNG